MPNPIAVAIPLFFVAIAAELAVARLRGRSVYRFADAITDLSCGVTQQVTVQWLAVLHGPYAWMWANLPHPELPVPWQHVVAFLAVDLTYYAWHRFTHESNLGWWSHVVHHQSEDYNLAVALRQSLSSALTSWPFHLPLVFLGLPPEVVLLHSALNTLYQFWIHTELVPELGPLEYVINTPSAHRVHHAVNPGYLDKNYAGVLIVWDRLFGTFVRETEPCVYGTVERFASTSPLYANTWWARQVLSDAASAVRVGNVGDALQVLVRPPAWRPRHLPPHPAPVPIRPGDLPKFEPAPDRWLMARVTVEFALVGVAVEVLLLGEHTLPWAAHAALGGWVFVTTMTWGAWFERRRGVLALEALRAPLGLAAAWLLLPPAAALGVALGSTTLAAGFALGPGRAALAR
jgi:alkylglycerol monooxygenase